MNDLCGKRLLVLGGTRISCEIVRKAHELGVTVGVADYNEPAKSPAKLIADEGYLVSATDVGGVVSLIQDRRFDGVLTGFADVLLPCYARICETAGLPCYGTEEQFRIFIDKDRYKAVLAEHGVPTVPGTRVSSPEEFERSDMRCPVVVKPADSSGSRGVTVCWDARDAPGAIRDALGFSASGTVLVERYMTGREATVFWLFRDGACKVSALGNRHMRSDQGKGIALPVGYSFPSNLLPRYLDHVAPKARAMFEDLGVRDGMMFMQCFEEGGDLLVYDIGYRLTGSLEYQIIERACGTSPLAMLINHALTGEMCSAEEFTAIDPYMGGAYCYNVSTLMRPGVVGAIEGVADVEALPGVVGTFISYVPGEELPFSAVGELRQIAVRTLGVAPDKAGLAQSIGDVVRSIRVASPTGEDLTLPGLDASELEGVLVTRR